MALYLGDLEKRIKYPYDRFKLSLYTEDKLVCPVDPKLSVFIAKLLQEKGIELFVGQRLQDVDETERSAEIVGQDGSISQVEFDNLIIEPKVSPDHLLAKAGPIDFSTLTSQSGAFVLGQCLQPTLPEVNDREIERQADVIAAQLLGRPSKYEYSPEISVRTGLRSSMSLALDASGRVRFHEEYSGLSFRAKALVDGISSKAEALTRELLY